MIRVKTKSGNMYMFRKTPAGKLMFTNVNNMTEGLVQGKIRIRMGEKMSIKFLKFDPCTGRFGYEPMLAISTPVQEVIID